MKKATTFIFCLLTALLVYGQSNHSNLDREEVSIIRDKEFNNILELPPIHLKGGVPGAAVLWYPANGANIAPTFQYLEWEAGEGPEPDGYKVYLDEVNPPQDMVYDGTDLNFVVTNLEYDKEYYWKVVPYNDQGEAVDVPVWHFTTYNLITIWEEGFITTGVDTIWEVYNHSGADYEWFFPGVRAEIYTPFSKEEQTPVWSTLKSPVIDCSGYENVRLFVNHELWHYMEYENYYGSIEISVDDQNWIEVVRYEGQLVENKDFGWGLPYHEFDVSSWVDDQSAVRVRLEFNSNGDLDLEWLIDKIGFKATTIEMGPPSLLSPSDGAIHQPLDITLQWQQGDGPEPEGYRLHVEENYPPQTIVYDGTDTEFFMQDLEYETTYYWKVVPYIGDEEVADVSVWSFTTVPEHAGITEIPHYENFNNTEIPHLPFGWSEIVESTNIFAEIRTINLESDPFDQEPFIGPNHLRFQDGGHQEAELILVSPPVYADLNPLRIRFYAVTAGNSVSENNMIEVGVISDPDDPATFTPYGSVNVSLEYDHYMVSLENHSGSDNHIAFRAAMGSWGQFVYLDNIVIEETPDEPLQVILPDNLDFGPLENNYQILTKGISIRNWGGGTITIDPEDIYMSGPDVEYFSFENIETTVHLQAFDQLNIDITFEPLTPGEKHAVLHVADMEVPLHGESVHPDIVELPYLEDFDQVLAPNLPIGWRSIVESADPEARVVTREYFGFFPSEVNVLNFRNESDGNAELYLISPLIELAKDTDYIWVRFFAYTAHRHNHLVVGTMSDREDASTFNKVENVWIWAEGGFWEYAVRVPVTEESFYLAFKSDFYRRQRQMYLDNITIQVAPDQTPVNLLVKENSDEGATLEGVELKVLGHNPLTTREVYTDAAGMGSLMLEEGVHTVFANFNGYQESEVVFDVGEENLTLEIGMTHVVYPPFNLEVTTQEMEDGSALLEWNDPGESFEFRYDNGTMVSQLGVGGDWQQELRTLGSAFHHLAELQQVSWYLTEYGGPHDTINLWIAGLDEYGYPDVNQVLYWNDKVPNTDNQWNTYELPEPLMTPNGFYIGLGYDGFLGVGTDDGETHPYQFIPERHFVVNTIHSPFNNAIPIEEFGFPVNLMIRGHGYKIADLEFEEIPLPASNKELPELKLIKTESREIGLPKVNLGPMRSNPSFHVFLDDMDEPLAYWLNENHYKFSGLEAGTYTAGVQTAFSTIVSEIVDVPFNIEEHTSVVELDDNLKLKVFPNPADQIINVMAGEEIQKVNVFDLLGRMVYTEQVFDQSIQINIGGLREGIYLLQIQTQSGSATHRISVTR